MSNLISVRELIQRTEKQFSAANLFYGHGTDNALDEAFYIVMAGVGLKFDCAEAELDKAVEADILKKVEGLIDRRINQHIPVAYLVNQAWFAGHEFYVDENVLIPRSPFAELITSEFLPWVKPENVKSILDIGTGSGCIAIACAHMFPMAKIDAVDIDSAAIRVANKNVSLHELEDRVQVIQSNLYEQIKNKKYDLIISNPPYVGNAEMQTLPEEYKHEPVHALEADKNGLEIVERILQQSENFLNDDGVLIVEVGNSMEAVMQALPSYPLIWLEFEQGGDGVFLISKSELGSVDISSN